MLSKLNVRSEYHNSCEDSVFVKKENNMIIGCVADGCSTGINSHFASQLLCYIIERYTKPGLYKTQDIMNNQMLIHIFSTLMEFKEDLKLTNFNFLSTCILFVYYEDTKQLEVRVFGDGVYYVNDVEYKVDQNNTPDYIGHHLDDEYEEIINFINKYPVKTYYDVSRFMICSDGIERIERSALQSDSKVDPMKLLFAPPTTENYLQRMWNLIKRDKFIVSDDLTIVSYVH